MLAGLTRDTLHHAYLIAGEAGEDAALKAALETLFATKLTGNPDAHILETDTLTVADAREVVTFASRSAMVSGAPKIVLVISASIGIEAQNALLKTLEEPPANTHLFILTSNPDALLPTVRSRCQHVNIEHTTEHKGVELLNNQEALLKEIAKLAKDKNAAGMTELLNSLERHIATSNNKPAMRALLQAKEHFGDKGAMRKMLLESVALMV